MLHTVVTLALDCVRGFLVGGISVCCFVGRWRCFAWLKASCQCGRVFETALDEEDVVCEPQAGEARVVAALDESELLLFFNFDEYERAERSSLELFAFDVVLWCSLCVVEFGEYL